MDYDGAYRPFEDAAGDVAEHVAALGPSALLPLYVAAAQRRDESVIMAVAAEASRRFGRAPSEEWPAVAEAMEGPRGGQRANFGTTLHRLFVRRADGVIVHMSPLTLRMLGFGEVPPGAKLADVLPTLGERIPAISAQTLAGHVTRETRWYETPRGKWEYTTYTAPIRVGEAIVGAVSLVADTTPPGKSSHGMATTKV